VIVLHETLHEMHRKKQSGVIRKIDFKKAYDKLNWNCIQQTLQIKGFSPTWCKWVASFMEGGHVDIKVNVIVGQNFQTEKGVRQGDPLLPILFNIVVDMLTDLISRAKSVGQTKGVISDLTNDVLSILQYVDDTILFMEHSIDQAWNIKLLLSSFDQMSSLKINFYKSEIFCFGQAKEEERQYKQLLGCQIWSYLF
jgi:hypothetical protein